MIIQIALGIALGWFLLVILVAVAPYLVAVALSLLGLAAGAFVVYLLATGVYWLFSLSAAELLNLGLYAAFCVGDSSRDLERFAGGRMIILGGAIFLGLTRVTRWIVTGR